MIRLGKEARIYQDDRLVIRWYLPNGKFFSQGKRVPKSCLLTEEERKAYRDGGSIIAVKTIMKSRGWGLAQSWEFFKAQRGPVMKRGVPCR
jgi:hypothetical protein